MYNDPNTGQFQWGEVIQELIRNYMMMKMMGGDKKKSFDPVSQAATVGPATPESMGGIQGPPPTPPGSMQPQQFSRGQSPGMGAPTPGGNNRMAQLPPQLMQMLLQFLQKSQMQSPMRG